MTVIKKILPVIIILAVAGLFSVIVEFQKRSDDKKLSENMQEIVDFRVEDLSHELESFTIKNNTVSCEQRIILDVKKDITAYEVWQISHNLLWLCEPDYSWDCLMREYDGLDDSTKRHLKIEDCE